MENTLLTKVILEFKPPALPTTESDENFTDKPVGHAPLHPQRIPPFLMALWNIFSRKELLNYLEEVNLMGQTALIYAVRNDFFEVADFLVNICRVNVNQCNKMGNSALHVAVLNNRRKIVEMLVNAKIDVLMENKEGYSCLIHSQKMELVEMCNYLDPVIVHAEIWQQKNCLVKILLNKNRTKFKSLSTDVFREIIKYA